MQSPYHGAEALGEGNIIRTHKHGKENEGERDREERADDDSDGRDVVPILLDFQLGPLQRNKEGRKEEKRKEKKNIWP